MANIINSASAHVTQLQELLRAKEVLLRRREVEQRVGLCRSSIYRRMREGTFPLAVSIGGTSVRWKLSQIEAFIASCTSNVN